MPWVIFEQVCLILNIEETIDERIVVTCFHLRIGSHPLHNLHPIFEQSQDLNFYCKHPLNLSCSFHNGCAHVVDVELNHTILLTLLITKKKKNKGASPSYPYSPKSKHFKGGIHYQFCIYDRSCSFCFMISSFNFTPFLSMCGSFFNSNFSRVSLCPS